MFTETRFTAMLQSLEANRPLKGLFEQLLSAYTQPNRHYHNAGHVGDCLELFDSARQLATQPGELEAAIWFHDAVYESRAEDNELRSAEWAEQGLVEAGVAEECVRRIGQLVLATKHEATPNLADSKLMVDIDLSILGRNSERFDEYDLAIRREFEWVPDGQYRPARAAVLRSFLDRAQIYSTSEFRQRFETTARANLTRAIRRLESSNRH